MISIISFTDIKSAEAEMAFAIRSAVFVDEQKVSREEEFDEFEETATHYLAFYNDIPCAAARWRVTTKGVKLERFAVLLEYRGKGIGEAILLEVLKHVIPLNKKIYLHAQLSAEKFYAKNGFVPHGENFWEANIEHVTMIFNS